MLKVLLFIWQLPQNILGFILFKLLKCKCYEFQGIHYHLTDKIDSGVSLGNFIIISKKKGFALWNVLYHEYGHQKQSRILGPLYLPLIGVHSFLGNIFDRIFHRKWDNLRRSKWYYSQPWEKWADKLGGVKR